MTTLAAHKHAAVAFTCVCALFCAAGAGVSTVWAAKVVKVPKVPGPDLAAATKAAAVAPPAQTEPITEPPTEARSGIDAAYEATGLNAFLRIFPFLLSSPEPGELGSPRADLTTPQWLAFQEGRLAFLRRFTPDDGLGPNYDAAACVDCHAVPAAAGAGYGDDQTVLMHIPPWSRGFAASVRRASTGNFVLERATGRTVRLTTPSLFGLGYLDEVPEAARAALEDPDDRDGDGVRGRRGVVTIAASAPARFGAKSHSRDLLRACASELDVRMGVTTAVRDDARADLDGVSDPELVAAEVEKLAAYVRGLERPPQMPLTGIAEGGAKAFDTIGCTGCHSAKIGDLEGAYTDTLLHDMGSALAGPGLGEAGVGAAGLALWRTPPLWGLRLRRRFLHDGRADTVLAAILAHGGEASRARDAFKKLPQQTRDMIGFFLMSR